MTAFEDALKEFDQKSGDSEESGVVEYDYDIEDPTAHTPFDWRSTLRNNLLVNARKWSSALNVSPHAMEAYVKDNFDTVWRLVQPDTIKREITTDGDVMQVGDPGSRKPTPGEWQIIWDKALAELSIGLGVDLRQPIPTGGGGRGRGSSGPTAADIRNMFDEDELTDSVQKIWGAHLLEDAPNARAIARNYINAIVKTGAQKEIDFETFVKDQMKSTSRWNLIYQNKPEGVDPLQYVQPYMQLATSVMGGQGNPGSVAAGGAALGATSEAFQQRLRRTDQHTSSGGFLSGLEDRARSAGQILRG